MITIFTLDDLNEIFSFKVTFDEKTKRVNVYPLEGYDEKTYKSKFEKNPVLFVIAKKVWYIKNEIFIAHLHDMSYLYIGADMYYFSALSPITSAFSSSATMYDKYCIFPYATDGNNCYLFNGEVIVPASENPYEDYEKDNNIAIGNINMWEGFL